MVRVWFSLGLGPIPAILSAELLPNEVRSRGMGVTSFVNWVANGVISTTFLDISALEKRLRGDQLDGVSFTFWLYAVFSAIGFVWVYYFVVETKSMTLEEVGARPRRSSTTNTQTTTRSRVRQL